MEGSRHIFSHSVRAAILDMVRDMAAPALPNSEIQIFKASCSTNSRFEAAFAGFHHAFRPLTPHLYKPPVAIASKIRCHQPPRLSLTCTAAPKLQSHSIQVISQTLVLRAL